MYFTTLPLDVSPRNPFLKLSPKFFALALCDKNLLQELFATTFMLLVGFGDGERPVASLAAGVHWL